MSNHACYHCGDDCGSYPVKLDDKFFCCNGCKTVYEILKGKKLYKYYQIEGNPGNKYVSNIDKNKYAFLNNQEIQKEILDFTDNNISKVTFFIPSIHCSSCIWLLENLNTLHNGITISKVNFTQKKVYITYNNQKINLKEIAELLESISYVPLISKEEGHANKKKNAYVKNLVIKLGIAGFCFGNIMLLSFPEYFSEDISQTFTTKYFRWLNLLLALPVFFYSSSVFFESAFKNLIKKNINIDLPVAIGIITIFLRSVYEIVSNTGPGYMDSLTGLVFFLLIGRWYQNKTYQALSFDRGFKSYFPLAANVLVGKEEIPTAINNIKPGDQLIIRNKELIPVDSVLIQGDGNIDYSFVTGESVPVLKTKGENLFAGGRQVGNIITVEAKKEVSQSYFTQLWNQDHKTIHETRVTSVVNIVSKYFVSIILILAVASFLFWQIIDPSKAFNSFTAILIIACPCALALAAPFTFGATMRLFAKTGLFMRDAGIVENLSKIDTIVFDKTGTITKNNSFNIEYNGEKLDQKTKSAIKSILKHSAHPLSIALYNDMEDVGVINTKFFNELPGKGIEGKSGDMNIKLGSADYTGFNKNEIKEHGSIVTLTINKKSKGYFTLKNHYRENMPEVINNLNNYGLHLLSGDNETEKPYLSGFFKNMKFNQKPEEKLQYVRKLKNDGKNVLMIGDGLNDAGALSESNTAISLADNVYQFSPSCDAILSAESFKKLPKLIGFTKTAMNILYMSFVISFLYNGIGLSFAFMGKLEPVIAAILMPVSSVSVVALSTFMIMLMGKAKKIV